MTLSGGVSQPLPYLCKCHHIPLRQPRLRTVADGDILILRVGESFVKKSGSFYTFCDIFSLSRRLFTSSQHGRGLVVDINMFSYFFKKSVRNSVSIVFDKYLFYLIVFVSSRHHLSHDHFRRMIASLGLCWFFHLLFYDIKSFCHSLQVCDHFRSIMCVYCLVTLTTNS